MSVIANVHDLDKALATPYAWSGGYPTYFFMADGAAICHGCAKENRALLADAIANKHDKQWQPTHHLINYEDAELACAHCNSLIESASGKAEKS